jgi:hypothetical protein
MDMKEKGGDVGWIHLYEDRVQMAGCCENSNEPSGPIKAGNFVTVS